MTLARQMFNYIMLLAKWWLFFEISFGVMVFFAVLYRYYSGQWDGVQ